MKVLLVQPYGDNHEYDCEIISNEIKGLLKKSKQSVDLVVFPEGYEYAENVDKECWDKVIDVANDLNTPVLMGFSTSIGTEEAYYFNPHVNPDHPKGETASSVYIKHSTSQCVFFDGNFSDDFVDLVYSPFILKGKKIQICICHDMFYPLLMERLELEGMDILINLTGGNVKMSKWGSILKGRSLEIQGPVLCTMGNRTSMRQKSDRITYNNGNLLKPTYEMGDGTKQNAYSIFDLNQEQTSPQEEPHYSDKQYKHFTVGYHDEDVVISEDGILISNVPELDIMESSIRLKKGKDIIHVHACTEEDLYNRKYVFLQPRFEKNHEVFIYNCKNNIDYETAVAFAKLRAIENRIAVVISTPDYTIGAKTNRYKDVQLFRGESIGFDLEHMYGFDSVYEKSIKSKNGINLIFKEKYESLIDL